jgi:DNA helicase-2/ATP-dependent DNA helicase PcrA
MGKFIPSKYQKDIFNFILNDTRNAVISAVAGSGKTTTLLKSLEIIPADKSVLFLAFNKSIAKELKERVPEGRNIDVKTVHGFGYLTLSRLNNPKIDNGKYRKLLWDTINFNSGKDETSLDEYGFDKEYLRYIELMMSSVKSESVDIYKFVTDVVNLCNLARLHLINFDIKPIGVSDLNKLADIHSISNEDNESTVAWYLAKLGLFYTKAIDYTDMIVLPNIMNLQTETYDFVFIDECQDLNTCQRLLMERAIKPEAGRFIAVGDPKQAIYAFAGADYESYQKLKNIPNTIELPLSFTYRSASVIVNMVKHINPIIKPHPKNKVGQVHDSFSYKNVQDGDMVLCRNTFPVVSLCIKYLSEGKKAFIIGSDIGLSLKNMILGCQRKTEEFTMVNVFSRLYHEKEKLIEKVMTNHKLSKSEAGDDNQVVTFTEKIQVIEALSNGITDPNEVVKKIDDLFSDDKKSGICLSNIHKSKGLEANRVFILHSELMPSKFARLPWEMEQERNLEYVAYTRAKTTLGFIDDYDAFKSHKSQSDNLQKVNVSKHIGQPGMKMFFGDLKVLDIREIDGKFGKTLVYEMMDKEGNILSKFGEISDDYLIGRGDEVNVDSRVSFYGVIKSHSEFRGNKTTQLGKISQY